MSRPNTMNDARVGLLEDYSDHDEPDDRLKKTRNEVNSVIDIMRNNMEKVLDRDAKLGDLEDKSEHLMNGANAFKRGTKKISRQMWWQNHRITCFLILAVIVIAVIIGLKYGLKKKD
eukprot:m.300464 g.300464  ORF g.300464 m.300464 type:complete len:117 (+) comp16421_c1_seq35:237-587(+)